MKAASLLPLIGIVVSLHCDKEFNYYDTYGHGFDITCQGITEQHLHLLSNITISNEISLTLENSTLTNVTSALFHNVRHLRCFYIENSSFSFPRQHQIFKLLDSLEHLVIKNTPISIDKNTLVGLESIKELVLSNVGLKELETGSLEGLSKLRSLQLINNQIVHVENLPLCEVRDLKVLGLSKNLVEILSDEAFYCRTIKQAMSVDLNDQTYKVDVQRNDFSTITDFALELTHLDLSYNKIGEIGPALSVLKFLRVLKFEGNMLSRLQNIELQFLYNIEEIYLSNNSLHEIDDKVFENKEDLEYLDLSHNRLENVSISELPELRYLNLGCNRLTSISFLGLVGLRALRTLILCNNAFREVAPQSLERLVALETLDLSHNKIELDNGSFGGMFHLKTLLLRNNSILALPNNVFSSLSNLNALDLSHNKLKLIEYNDTFISLVNLEVLNISFNLLEDLNYALLQPLDNLHILDVSGNKLKFIQYDVILSNLPLLSVLNIKSNDLSCEILYKMVKFLKQKNVTYTMVEKFDYERENIAGIYCSSETSAARVKTSSDRSVLTDLSAAIFAIAALVLVGVGVFRFHVYLKRRRYRADEFELIDE